MNSSGDSFHTTPYQIAFQNGLGQNYYMATPASTPYYTPAMSPDVSGMYGPMMNMHAWPPTQQSVSPFDPSRPPPPINVKPPLPTSPPPERPPMPPPIAGTMQANYATSLYRGRGAPARRVFGTRRMLGKFKGFNREQMLANSHNPPPTTSGLQIKSPESLNEQVIDPALLGGKKNQNEANKHLESNLPVVSKKKKRRPMSERRPTSVWKREDAQRVLDLEKEYSRKRGDKSIVIRFPDPKLDYEVVKSFSSAIQSVHFQNPAGPRSCIVHLKQGSEMEKVIEEINKTPFGQGFLSAEERRKDDAEDEELRINDIDPYTLYVGNLPWNTHSDDFKRMFSKAKKVDLGYAQKMKATRYGFVRYLAVDDAIEAYKKYVNELYESRSIIVRFRRNNSSVTEGNNRKTKKDSDSTPEKPHSLNTETETEYAGSESWGEEETEVEDSKCDIFESINNLTGNDNDACFSDDMTEDLSEDEASNLTGLIKTEPDDEINEEPQEVSEMYEEFLGPECDDELPEPPQPTGQVDSQPGTLRDRLFSDSDEKDEKRPLPAIPSVNEKESTSQVSRRRKDWEQIRQEELNTKEVKPDIHTLNTPPPPPPIPTISSTEAAHPLTTFGVVPKVVPKFEKSEERNEDAKPEIDDFDDFDEAFAWSTSEVTAN